MTVRTLLLAAALAAVLAAAAIAGTPFRWSTSPGLTAVSASGEVAIGGAAAGRRGVVRVRYVLPRSWRRDSALTRRTIRFDTRNSCRHKVAFVARLAEAADVPAAERAASLTPATAPFVRASGTREGAAFRVVRTQGSSDLVGVLVQPLPASSTPGVPAGRRVFAEIEARATADPRTECHSGGPRTVGDAIGDAFGAGRAGGFVPRP
jgi:hypothetical protein